MVIDPTVFDLIPAVEVLHVGFDVQEWRAVQNIDFRECDSRTLYAFKLHDGEPDMIRPVRAPYSEDPMLHVLKEGFAGETFLFRTVEKVDQNNVRKSFNIFKPCMIFRKKPDSTGNPFFKFPLNRDPFGLLIRRVDYAYWLDRDRFLHLKRYHLIALFNDIIHVLHG